MSHRASASDRIRSGSATTAPSRARAARRHRSGCAPWHRVASTSTSTTAARSSTSRASGSASSSACTGRRPPRRRRGTPAGTTSSANSASTSHGAIASQFCTSNAIATNSAFSGARPASAGRTCSCGRRVPRSATAHQVGDRHAHLGRNLTGVQLADVDVRMSLTTDIAASPSRADASGGLGRLAVERPSQPESEERLGGVDRRRQRVGIALGQLTRNIALREGRHADLDLVLLVPLVEALGRSLAGVVGVERQHHPARVALQQTHVLLGERRSARCDRSRHARQVESDHVGVALAHDHLVGVDDVAFGPIQSVERLRLRVDRRFR